jgi:hypothetical protein
VDDISLEADCRHCAALCCLSLAFDRSALFAFDKAAGVACPHLDARHGCGVHAEREQRGFAGCATYDCLGAGQRVTQELFEGRSWRDDPALVAPMMDAFWSLRQVHESWFLLRQCRTLHSSGRLPLTARQAERQRELEHALQTDTGGASAQLRAFEREQLGSKVAAFLQSLRAEHPVEACSPDKRGRRRLPLAGATPASKRT